MLVLYRLVGRKPKSYNINLEASKVAYQTSQNDVKIYMETSNGIQKGRQYNQVRLSFIGRRVQEVKGYRLTFEIPSISPRS